MWVEVDHNKVATSFNKYDKIRVSVDNGPDYEGVFIKHERGGPYVHLSQPGSDYPVCLYVWSGRKFYHWVEDTPNDGHNRLDIDESKLRLRKPHVQPCWGKCCNDPDTQAEVEAAEAALVKRIERLEEQVGRTVVVDRVAYTVREGDHLSVWWEDGRLHTEYVQGEKQ